MVGVGIERIQAGRYGLTKGEDIGYEQSQDDESADSQRNHDAREYILHFAMSGDIGRRFRRMLYKPQILGGMRLRHQRPISAAGQAMLDPRRILVTGYTDTKIEGAPAQPTEKNFFVRQFAAVPTLLFS